MKKIFLTFSLAACFSAGYAQELSLDQYRQKVLEYNQEIKKSQEGINAAIYSLKGIKTGFFPRLDVSGDYSYQIEEIAFMQGVNLKHDNFGVEAGLVQNLYSGGAVKKQYDAAKIQEAIARLGVDYTIDNIVYAADVNYWTVAANRDLYDLSKRFVSIVGELYDIVNKRFEEGAISRTDLLMVQTRLKEAELQLNTTETNYRTALQGLNIMMGQPVDMAVFLTDSIRKTLMIPMFQELDRALENRADYQMATKDFELAKMQTRLVKSNYLPQLVVGFKEKYGTTLINIDGSSKWSSIAFAQLKIPVFHWGERRQNVRVSQTQEEIKDLDRSKLEDQVSLELNNAWVNLTEAAKKLDIVNSTLDIAQSNLMLNTFSYNEGKLPILDVLSAQVTWLQTYTNVVSVNYQYKVAQAQYVKALGGEN